MHATQNHNGVQNISNTSLTFMLPYCHPLTFKPSLITYKKKKRPSLSTSLFLPVSLAVFPSSEVSQPQCQCLQADLTCLCGCCFSFSQVSSVLLHWHTKHLKTAAETSAALGEGWSRVKWTQFRRSRPRSGTWDKNRHRNDPCSAATFTILIDFSL